MKDSSWVDISRAVISGTWLIWDGDTRNGVIKGSEIKRGDISDGGTKNEGIR